MSHFLAILKNSKKILKNIKSDLQIDFHMKSILTGRIDHLNFKDEEKRSVAHRPPVLRVAP
jgi:hypothetical protein